MALLVHVHQPGPLWVQIVCAVLFLIALRCSVMDLADLERTLGQAVRDALMLARITEEQAADLMRMDASTLRKCLRGDPRLQLGLARLMRLPFAFWLHLTPVLMYLVAKRNVEQIAHDLGLKVKS